MAHLVEVRDLHVTFQTSGGPVYAVSGVNLNLAEGKTLALIGESGSGKSVTMKSLMRLHPERKTTITGQITVADRDVLALDQRQLADIRGQEIAMV